ncbi:MAG TPA: molybdenum cofactor guanylyltransferase MobA [Rhodobacteraceae bacterium]|jgi:molybdopterin-guanine dinucleotide biosynthesis protein A|nr:molybdenum cofactor guanylyltransferase MobA [Paracoccaceae bacterium]
MTELLKTRVGGVILAGGKATRMGGGDKGMRAVGDRRLIDHVITRITPQVAQVALNANGDAARFSEFGLPVLADGLPDYPGPLAGVLAGMDWAAEQGFDAVVSVAADTPFFPMNLVKDLSQHAGPSGLCLAASPDETGRIQRQPTFGLWPVALRHDLRAALVDGLRKIVIWTERHKAGQAVFVETANPFFNVNTPDELLQAEAIARRLG